MGFLPHRSKVVIRYILEEQAATQPDKECVFFEDGESWTYGDALQEAYRAANALSQIGIKRGENVLVFLPNSQRWLRAWWGITILGAVLVPVNTAYKGEMLRHICQDSQASYIIIKPDLAERLKGFVPSLKNIDPSILTEGSTDEPKLDEPIEPWDTHAIIYTSGTTGPSKGVSVTYFRSYTDGQWWWGDKLLTSDDTILADLPFFHVSGISSVYGPLAVGGRIAVRTVFSASRYLDIVRECGVTLAVLVGTMPTFLALTPPQPDDADNPLRVVQCSPMVSDPAAFIERFGLEKLVTGYGMSEICQTFWTDNPMVNPKSCGRPTSLVEVRLVDGHDIPVRLGEVGELIIRTELPWITNVGYWQRPEETAKAWANGWFHTGDLFYCDEGGNYFFVDRKKDALRYRGENISSFEVEKEVLAYPDVLEAACVGVPGEYGGDEVKVIIVPRDASKFDPVDLIKFLIPRMPYFMVPRYIQVMDELPKTPTMRVKKFQLREQGFTNNTWDREAAGIKVTRDS